VTMFQSGHHLLRQARAARIRPEGFRGETLLKLATCVYGSRFTHSGTPNLQVEKPPQYLDHSKVTAHLDLDSVNYHHIFATKTLTDLIRAIGVLKVCSFDTFVANASKVGTCMCERNRYLKTNRLKVIRGVRGASHYPTNYCRAKRDFLVTRPS
jgi:hypothetical protein